MGFFAFEIKTNSVIIYTRNRKIMAVFNCHALCVYFFKYGLNKNSLLDPSGCGQNEETTYILSIYRHNNVSFHIVNPFFRALESGLCQAL